MPKNDDIFAFSIYAFAFTLPLSLLANNIIAIVVIISQLAFIISGRAKNFKINWLLILPIALYLLDTISLTYTVNISDGFFELEKKFLIFILPCLALLDNRYSNKIKVDIVLNIFSLSILIVCLSCHGIAIIDIVNKKLPLSEFIDYEYSGHELFKPFKLHATYIGIYLLLVAYHIYVKINQQISPQSKLVLSTVMIYVIFCIFHTSSRIVFILFLTMIAFVIFRYFNKFSFALRILLSIFFVMILGILSYYLLPFLAYKFLWIKELMFLPEVTDINKLEYLRNERAYLWPVAFELIKESPILGYGPGDVIDQLVIIYRDKGYTHWENGRFNVHSQYLHTWLSTGAVGLILLGSMLAFSMLNGLKKSIHLFILGFLISGVCITEVFFGLHQGIAFFAFFYVIFIKNASE